MWQDWTQPCSLSSNAMCMQLLHTGRMQLRYATALAFCQFNSSIQKKAMTAEPTEKKKKKSLA